MDIDTHSSIEDIYERKIYSRPTLPNIQNKRRSSWLDNDASSLHFSEFLQRRDFLSKMTEQKYGSGNRVDSNANLNLEYYDHYHEAVGIDKVMNYENYFPHNNI